MKKLLVVGFSVLACSVAMADGRGGDQIGWGQIPIPGPIRGGDMGRGNDPVQVCLMDLHRTQSELQICLSSRIDPRELDRLHAENDQLRRENDSLRLQLEQMNRDRQGPRDPRDPRIPRDPRDPRDTGSSRSLGFFTYAGCRNFQGNTDLKFIASGEGRVQLESETTAEQKVAQSYSCNFGVKVEKTEEIKTTEQLSYCVAGCIDFQGNVDQKFIQSGRGRNKTEAEFLALKAAGSAFSCNFGIKVQACQ